MNTDIETCKKMLDINIVNTTKDLNPQKVGEEITFNEKYLSSSTYKAQLLSNQVLIMQGLKLQLGRPA